MRVVSRKSFEGPLLFPVCEDVCEAEVVVRGLRVEVEEVRHVQVPRAQRVAEAARVGGAVVVDLDPLHVELQHQLAVLHVVEFGVRVDPGNVGMGRHSNLKDTLLIGYKSVVSQ